YQPQTYLGRRRILTLTMCGDRRGRTPMHRVALAGRDPEDAARLRSAGLSVRPARADGGPSWRVETACKDLGQAHEIAERVASVVDVTRVCVGRFGAAQGNGSVNASLPCIPASSVRPGMVMFTATGDYDVVESVERVALDATVHDLDIEN